MIETDSTEDAIERSPSRSQGDGRFAHLGVIARGSSLVMLGLVGGAALQYGYNFGLARLFGATVTGQVVFALSLVTIVAVIGQLGAQELVLRYVASYRGVGDDAKLRGVLLTSVLLGVTGASLLSLLLWVSADQVAALAGKPEMADVLRRLVWLAPFLTLATILAAAFQGARRLEKTVLLREVGKPLAIFAALIAVWVLGRSVSIFLQLTIGVLAFIALGGLVLAWREFAGARQGPRVQFMAGEWLRFSLSVMLMDVFRSTAGWMDTLILGFFAPAEDVAIYFAAVRTALLITIVLAAFNAILAPLAADLWHRSDIQQLERVFKTTTRWTCVAVLPITIATVLVRNELMALFGDVYAGAGTILLIIILGRTVNGLTGGVGRMLVMTGHQRVELINTVVTTAVSMLGIAWAAQSYGVRGVAVVSSLMLVVKSAIKLSQVRWLIGIQPYERSYGKLVVASVLAAIVGYGAYLMLAGGHGVVVLAAVPASVLLSYGVVLMAAGLEAEDKALLRQVQRRLSGVK